MALSSVQFSWHMYVYFIPLELKITIGFYDVSPAYENALVNLADKSDRRGRVSGKLDLNSLEKWFPSL